ncbi:MAG: DNA gyrase subunit A [candidate division TA06 bacterium 32_111]|uniref:DNA gyrase subunit A n=2 Tax=Bacteria candidate phyla TaxID=1783234 RepID=A0A101I133_UNCT6|nr:MAG: DNA gyrase subunit A [candidate division TA06 bacterium 32_111]KUK87077.1 MAG: DNA gyrase subunit A [candidate division TA06 bacterium 34_109]HAF07662.1 DNA gyrase subunit A [candidate division WOR-3 bacterium]HCP17450.1 DNA gyrase subunit A [candidate division WOR-3 bacterium]
MDINRQRVIDVTIEDEMKSSYLDYAMSVIISRALPDVRDGLKPVHRRILYAMKELGLYHNKPFKKSATVVGDVLGKYHPHGDMAVYESLVRMVQDFSLRYPLVKGQGNFGSIDGDSAAAYRYTEAKLSKIAEEMLVDIDKDTIDFMPNFDGSYKEPVVLPSKFPNILANGTSGIAVGMATNIPPHNITELVDGMVAYIDDQDIPVDKLMKYIKGPDFPTGGIIQGVSGVKKAYETGKGQIIIKGKVKFETKKNDKEQIIITEIPYQTNKTKLIEKIADLVNNKVIEDISDIRDESDRDGMRIVLELKRGAEKKVVLNKLYKHTQLKTTYSIMFICLVNNEPKVLGLKDIIFNYIKHREVVVKRRTEFDLKKAEERAHIVEGLKIALSNIDEVVRIIKTSENVQDASEKLQEKFKLSKVQANAILEMKLSRLTGLEREKLDEEYEELIKLIEKLKFILSSEKNILNVVKEELLEIKKEYGDERLTEIVPSEDEELEIEDLIADENVIVTITHQGYIKRQSISSYRKQNRGGKGIIGLTTKDDDFAEKIFIASTHQYILFFTNRGKVYWLKVFQIPEGGRTSKGRAIVNLLELEKGEEIMGSVPVREFDDKHFVFIITKNGIAKKTVLSAFRNPRKGGIIALSLNDEDNVADVALTDGNNDVIIVTKWGMAIRFNENEVRDMGRSATGVRGVTLDKDDEVVSMVVVKRESTLFIATENGFGKRSEMQEYRKTHRGGKGVIAIKTHERNGAVVDAIEVLDNDELLLIAESGQIVRIAVSDIRVIGRNTGGVRLMNLTEGDKLVDVAIIAHEYSTGDNGFEKSDENENLAQEEIEEEKKDKAKLDENEE